MGLISKLKELGSGRRRKEKPPRERGRRKDPDWGGLPGGSSTKEAEQAPPGRAGELAD
jgi:hypothetical protein